MSQAKKCPQCGTIVDLDARTCPGCQHFFRTTFDPGNPQVSERPVPTPLIPGAEQPPSRTTLVDVPRVFGQVRRRHSSAAPSTAFRDAAGAVFLVLVLALIAFAFYHFGAPPGR